MDEKAAREIMEEMRRGYDSIAGSFDETRSGLWGDVRPLLRHLHGAGRVLDAGCGAGRLAEDFPAEVAYTGVDFSPALIELAKAKRPAPNRAYLVGDVLELPFPEGSFDAAVSLAVIHHIPTRELRLRAARELARVIHAGGTLVVVVWSRDAVRPRAAAEIAEGEADYWVPWKRGPVPFRRYVHGFEQEELERLMVEAGFTLVESGKTSRADQRTGREDPANTFAVARRPEIG